MGSGIDGDGGRARRRDAARKRTAAAMFTCGKCGRRSVMRKTWLPDISRHVRTCRYCGAER